MLRPPLPPSSRRQLLSGAADEPTGWQEPLNGPGPSPPPATSAREPQEPAVQRARHLEGGFPGFPPHVSRGSTASLVPARRQPWQNFQPRFWKVANISPMVFPSRAARGSEEGMVAWRNRSAEATISKPPGLPCCSLSKAIFFPGSPRLFSLVRTIKWQHHAQPCFLRKRAEGSTEAAKQAAGLESLAASGQGG